MISFLPGAVMPRAGWGEILVTDDALVQAVEMLRELHAATIDLELPADTLWRSGPAAKVRGQVVRHGDLGPWNTLWEGDVLTGLIDWDFAEPGERITDVAQLALYFVPLRGEQHAVECGFSALDTLPHRLEVLCSTYGTFSPEEVLHEIERLQVASMVEIEERAAEGRYPWTMFRDNGEIAHTQAEVDWLRRTFPDAFPNHPADPSPTAS